MDFAGYDSKLFFDELLSEVGTAREGNTLLLSKLQQLESSDVIRKQEAAETNLSAMGVTFRVYGEESANLERTIPFDILPRVIPGSHWDEIEKGLSQRLRALNRFIDDMYHDQQIISDGVLPKWVVENAKGFLPQCVGLNPPAGVWSHFCGTDLVRDETGRFLVLEDNLRVPSGISYVLENRVAMTRVLPVAFARHHVEPVNHYGASLLRVLRSVAPPAAGDPNVVVLTPGVANSAYFEHAFLARQLGVEGRG